MLLADAARLGLVRYGRPEAWAAGAVVAVARVNGLLGTGRVVTAEQVADELEVSLGAVAAAEQQLARSLNLSSYATPAGCALKPQLVAPLVARRTQLGLVSPAVDDDRRQQRLPDLIYYAA